MGNNEAVTLDPRDREEELKTAVGEILAEAKKQGATACEVSVNFDTGLSAEARMGEPETVEFNRDYGFGITVYRGQKKGSASTSDSAPQSISETVRAACDIAHYGSEDPAAGLADASMMATVFPDLDLCHPWEIDAERALELAVACEQAGRSYSEQISNSDGASVSSHQGCRVYGNSHGFIASHLFSRHTLSCVLIGEQSGEMQRDYWYTTACDHVDLESAQSVGEKAARRTVERLGARKIATGNVPVLFAPEVASSLISHLLGAISGGSLYRESSFLLDHLGKQIFPDWVRIHEEPLLKKMLGSASFDGDGLATRSKAFVDGGVLDSYLLDTYSARKLGMESTANAGGVHNLFIDPNSDGTQLLKEMDRGFLVTELMGQGANIVTGDYSRGAGGFWVENGVIQHPVSEATVAGNLRDIFMNIVAVGDDIDRRGNIQTGSILVGEMTVAG